MPCETEFIVSNAEKRVGLPPGFLAGSRSLFIFTPSSIKLFCQYFAPLMLIFAGLISPSVVLWRFVELNCTFGLVRKSCTKSPLPLGIDSIIVLLIFCVPP